MSIAIEQQVIVTWHDPEKKLPEEGMDVVVTISGKRRSKRFECIEYDHAFAVAQYWEGDGWVIEDPDGRMPFDEFIIHAWCDLEPYGGRDA